MSTSKLKVAAVVIGLGLGSILTVPFAQASPILPGGTVAPDDLSAGPGTAPATWGVAGGTIVATNSGTFSNGNVSGSYVTDVVRTLLGTLDFLIQVTNSGTNALEHVTDGDGAATWSPWGPDVGVSFLNPIGGTFTAGLIPLNINESADGAVMSFNWPALPSGSTSALLVIATTAQFWTTGDLGFIDSIGAPGSGFIPTAVPGPIAGAGIPGLIAACGALLAFARRRRQKFA